MKVVQINATCGYGSTGKIAVDISRLLNKKGIENYILYAGNKSAYENGINYGSKSYLKMQALKTRILGNYGFNSELITRKLIYHLKKIQPDIVHLHNMHSHNANLPILFKYFKKNNIKVIWTFHDCWAFTGSCAYFDYVKCEKWKTLCSNCPQNTMSWFFDRTDYMYNTKKKLFTEIQNMTIVTPSKWLAGLVKQSFLNKYPVKVINNGIDLSLFKPTRSDFRKKYNIADKKILLGVAMGFKERKGFNYYLELAKLIDNDTYIVLVGVSKEQKESLPENVIGITRTANQTELAEIYTAADYFINCTLEDNFPTVNLEALACGTPVITFNTGGSIECIDSEIGAVVEQGDVKSILTEIKRLNQIKNISEKCIEKAEKFYDKNKCFLKYIEMYKNMGDC